MEVTLAGSRLNDIRVLIVDDEKPIIRLISDILGHLGFRDIAVARDGVEARDRLKMERFDFVITDWRMPRLEGIDLIRFVRHAPDSLSPRTPIIMLSGNSEEQYVTMARDAGVNEYMVKPFSASQLVRRLRAIIENPRSFIEAPHYHGPNRRWHDVPDQVQVERRKRRA